MNKPVINLIKYEVDSLLISRDFTSDDHEAEAFNLNAEVGHSDDNTHGAVKLSVVLIDKDALKKISVTIIGYFEINIKENIFDNLYVNGTAILYPIDSSEAMLLPTINVLELLDNSQHSEED